MNRFILSLAILFACATTAVDGLTLDSERAAGSSIAWLDYDHIDNSRDSDDPDKYRCNALRADRAQLTALPDCFHTYASLTSRPKKQSSIRAPPVT